MQQLSLVQMAEFAHRKGGRAKAFVGERKHTRVLVGLAWFYPKLRFVTVAAEGEDHGVRAGSRRPKPR